MQNNVRFNILVVDDQEWMSIIEYIEAKGDYEVSGVSSGSEAIKMLREHSFDLVLLDIFMDEMDGFEVLQKIKDHSIRTRIIMMSAYAKDVETVTRCIRNGASDYIKKPFKLSKLHSKIERCLYIDAPLGFSKNIPDDITEMIAKDADELRHKNKNLQNELNEISSNFLEKERELEDLAIKYKYLKKKSSVFDAFIKVAYGIIAISLAIFFGDFFEIQNKLMILALAIFLFIFFLLPADRIRNLRASSGENEINVNLQ